MGYTVIKLVEGLTQTGVNMMLTITVEEVAKVLEAGKGADHWAVWAQTCHAFADLFAQVAEDAGEPPFDRLSFFEAVDFEYVFNHYNWRLELGLIEFRADRQWYKVLDGSLLWGELVEN